VFSLLIAAMVNALDSLLYASLSVIGNAVTMVFLFIFCLCSGDSRRDHAS
jgi:hypothetical protein